jgi:hypothetical protein
MKSTAYNELYQSVWEASPDQWEPSPYFHIGGDEGYPYNKWNLPGLGLPGVEQPSDLDRQQNHQMNGQEFDEIKGFDDRKKRRIKRFIELRKAMQDKKDNPLLNPHSYYTSQYGSLTGVEGLNSFPMDYIGTVADDPGAMVNPWQNIYQSASDTSERIKLRALFLNNFLIKE